MCVRVEQGKRVETKRVVKHERAKAGGEVVLQVLTHWQVCHYRNPKLRKAGMIIFKDYGKVADLGEGWVVWSCRYCLTTGITS